MGDALLDRLVRAGITFRVLPAAGPTGAVAVGGLTLDLVEASASCGVESELLSIGELARASGLTVSALRFYDRRGVLAPALVDPGTATAGTPATRWRRPGWWPGCAGSACRWPRSPPRCGSDRAGAVTGCSTRTCAGWRTVSPTPAGNSPGSVP